MSQKRHSVDQIIAKLRRADVLLGQDTKVPEICKQLKIAEQTLLPLASEVRRYAARHDKAVQSFGKRERSAEEDGGRAGTRHGDPEGSREGKLVNPERRRRTVAEVRRRFGPEKCRSVGPVACSVNRVARSVTNHYAPMMNRSYFTRCVPLPDSVHALEQSVSTSY